MQFKHPEILYALLLLLIPIFIHLFQLRRFQKVPFSNVAFLKQITIQTRKSSEIKKWLTLLTRLLLLASIIFAFSQPYLSNKESYSTKRETVIYLDNSFSMQAKGEKGVLLKRCIQDLLENIDGEENLTLITNNLIFKNTTLNSIKNDLLQLGFSTNQLNYESALLKAENSFSKDENSLKNLIFISDFQDKNEEILPFKNFGEQIHFIQVNPVNVNNISVDSLYISDKTTSEIEISVIIKNQGEFIEDLPISLYKQDKLIAKTSLDIEDESKVNFSLNANEGIEGKIVINDTQLQFDNILYFNFNKQDKINILSINNSDDSYLKKIYNKEEFNYQSAELNKLNYSEIDKQSLIILNELNDIPNSLINALNSVIKRNGSILTIPSNNIILNSYNQLFNKLSSINYNPIIKSEKKIININFSHPLYRDVFNNQINNFQFPKVNSYYPTDSNSAVAILSYEDGTPFLIGYNNIFIFSASLNTSNSNFQNSPLIVPTLFNIGKQSLQLSKPYYTIGKENTIDINASLQNDEIVNLENKEIRVIPQQQTFKNKVTIMTSETPDVAGIYQIKNNEQYLESLSFNYDRAESQLNYLNLKQNDVKVSNSIIDVLTNIKSRTKVNELWKWFVIFALLMLIIEMLILKFYK